MPSHPTTPAAPAASVAAAFASLPEVVAVALAGSGVTGAADEQSDLDLYVYAGAPVAMADRVAIATSFAARPEVGNEFWEPGDEWIDAETERHVDVMYRTPLWIEEQLERVLERHEASVGYSTCFWHNVLHSTPLFDRSGWYRDLQTAARRPYPQPLRSAIIARNHPILRQTLSSYLAQIERAVGRGDSVSIQHRVTALLASYFDVLFAINKLPHPGEKRLLQLAATRFTKTPPEMEAQINALLQTAARPASPVVVTHINALLNSLDDLLVTEGLIPMSLRRQDESEVGSRRSGGRAGRAGTDS
jgi:predicted nucleotidyltransferase